jgi:hypothetical protein
MSTPEGTVKYKIKAYLKSLEPQLWGFMPVPTGYGVRGIPDFVGCYKGRFFAIEAKRLGGKPKPWQDLVMRAITLAGGLVIVADCLENVTVAFEPFKDPTVIQP